MAGGDTCKTHAVIDPLIAIFNQKHKARDFIDVILLCQGGIVIKIVYLQAQFV